MSTALANVSSLRPRRSNLPMRDLSRRAPGKIIAPLSPRPMSKKALAESKSSKRNGFGASTSSKFCGTCWDHASGTGTGMCSSSASSAASCGFSCCGGATACVGAGGAKPWLCAGICTGRKGSPSESEVSAILASTGPRKTSRICRLISTSLAAT